MSPRPSRSFVPFDASSCHPLSAFTLIELLVVIGIIAVLAVIALPIYGRVMMQGHMTVTTSHMRQLNLAFIAYAQDNNYQMPGRVETAEVSESKKKWPALLLPYYQDVRILVGQIDPVKGDSYNVSDTNSLLSNNSNNSSFISNGYNDLGAHSSSDIQPRLNSFEEPMNTILVGIQYPKSGNFYMDSADHDQDTVLNRTAFKDRSVYAFADGSVRVLQYIEKLGNESVDMNKRPPNSGLYTDWLWQINKSIVMPP